MESASSFPHRMATMCRDNLTCKTTSSKSKKLMLRMGSGARENVEEDAR